ncbi:hypothetical protein FLB_15640 [Flavobacterium succinicans]|uniref:Uncharacterized protein n=1 Tax=Flavobacterium succinicans TaxID=29536 RepID=A0A199XQF6_9FLAO|nr:hypothetical protein FLB_15640 [Flavobacterium succinicans]
MNLWLCRRTNILLWIENECDAKSSPFIGLPKVLFVQIINTITFGYRLRYLKLWPTSIVYLLFIPLI